MVQEQVTRRKYIGKIMPIIDNNNGFVKFNSPIKANVYHAWLGCYKEIELLSVMNIGKVICGSDEYPRADVCECYAMSDDGTIWGLYDHFNTETLQKIMECVCGNSKLLEKLLNMSCPAFTEFMQSIGHFGENDYVAEYSPRAVGKMVAIGNELGCDVVLDIQNLHDYFIYGKKNGDTYEIVGLLDDSADWIERFKLEEIVMDYPDEVKYW